MINFEWWWAALFLPLPWIAYKFLPAVSKQDASLRVPFYQKAAELNPQSTQQNSTSIPWRSPRVTLSVVVWCLLVLATCRPQWLGAPQSMPSSGRDLMLAVDISGSMDFQDMVIQNRPVTRLNAVKAVVGDFTERREGDRVGLILFGTKAYLQAPLTFDRKTVKTLLYEAQLRMAGESTAIGDAIGLAIKRLRDREEGHRILVLLTDGANTAGEVAPLQAAELAQQAGVKIYTIGIGADKLMRMNPNSMFSTVRNPSADLDEKSLKSIADTTGGTYFRARDIAELESIYKTLDTLEPIEQTDAMFRPLKSLYMYPLGLAVAMVLTMMLTQIITRIWLQWQQEQKAQISPSSKSKSV